MDTAVQTVSRWPVWAGLAGMLGVIALAGAAGDERLPDCRRLDLPVKSLNAAPTAYLEFCGRHPPDCDMGGPHTAPASGNTVHRVLEINRQVNAEVKFMPDMECVGQEDRWDYPMGGVGDCEDFALEKRRRLVAAGLPRAAFTMAIGHHRRAGFSHAVLMAQMPGGTYVLDNLRDQVLCWSDAPYFFETRETPDGRWTRYDQSGWWGPTAVEPSASSAHRSTPQD